MRKEDRWYYTMYTAHTDSHTVVKVKSNHWGFWRWSYLKGQAPAATGLCGSPTEMMALSSTVMKFEYSL